MQYLKIVFAVIITLAYIFGCLWVFNHFEPFLGLIGLTLTPVPFIFYYKHKNKKHDEKSK